MELAGNLAAGAFLGDPGLLLTFSEDGSVALSFGDTLLGVDEGGLAQSSSHRVGGQDQAGTDRHRKDQQYARRPRGGVISSGDGELPSHRADD